MASHTKSELRAAVHDLIRAAVAAGVRPQASRPDVTPVVAETQAAASVRVFDADAREAHVARAA
jgi:hypothetical protein